jgi:hypothetical protein
MRHLVRWLAIGIAAGSFAAAGGADAQPVKSASSIGFAASAGVPPAVRDECQLQTQVPAAVRSAYPELELTSGAPDRKKGRVLELEIIEIHAPGGGAFSGPKWMTVSGQLYESGKLIGSVRAKRVTSGAAFQGTCPQMGRVARAVGGDIAAWLRAPSLNAEIGDAR